METHSYKTYNEYITTQTKVSKMKKGRSNIDKHIAVISNVKDSITERCNGKEKILCVGARNCNEVRAFRKLFPETDITAIDLSGIKNKWGLEINKWVNGCYVHFMDMNKLEFEDNSFDIIYAHHSLEHNPTPQKAAQEFVRVIKDGGIVYVIVPLLENPTDVECTKYEDEGDIAILFTGHIKRILHCRIYEAGEDMAEEKELRFAFEAI